eukprot:TRINITY_DN812_c0_g1_i4.p1 TRINITY_DN812_c0_g1~~TRINITY_DN812_c0_g1_i4.p1  ORF type:complete len:997 (+),score=153.73 TRINITY_DN812_c0_g1_i4:274-3264(+)
MYGDTWYVVSFKWWKIWVKSCAPSSIDATSTTATEEPIPLVSRADSHRIIPALESTTALELTPTTKATKFPAIHITAVKPTRSPPAVPASPASAQQSPSPKPPASVPPPLTNDDLLEGDYHTFQRLRARMFENFDYTLVPASAWFRLKKWYGGGPELPRYVISTGMPPILSVEVYPLCLRLYKCDPQGGIIRDLTYDCAVSKTATVLQFLEKICSQLKLRQNEVRLWSYYSSNVLWRLSQFDQTMSDARVMDGQIILIEVRNSEGKWPRSLQVQKQQEAVAAMDGAPGMPESVSGPGLVGIQNLGNTCYMAAALQCLSACRELTQYFLHDSFRSDINTENPLGLKGKLAEEYAELLHQMWDTGLAPVAPVSFKLTISRFASQFQGNAQHDADEVTSFILDGLHEDLNRVKIKPYIPLKDSDGRADLEVATECWQAHLERNRSMIVDMFHGQLKSTLVCPTCKYVKVNFDPVGSISLPLPGRHERVIHVRLMRKGHSVPTTFYAVRTLRGVSIGEFKKEIAKAIGLHPLCFVLAEVVAGRIFTFHHDAAPVYNIRQSDITYAFEVDPPEPAVGADGERTLWQALAVAEDLILTRTVQFKPLYVTVVHRKMEKDPLYERFPLFSLGLISTETHKWPKKSIAMGVPCMLSIPHGITCKDLHTMIAQYANQFYQAPTDPKEVVPAPGTLPFAIKFCDRSGSRCGICPESADCQGCPLKMTDDVAPLRDYCFLVVEWHYGAWLSDKMHNYTEDPSLTGVRLDSKILDLSECLNSYQLPERLSPDDLWFCPKCKVHGQATKSLELWRLPDVMILHLKRFNKFHYGEKLDIPVRYPIHSLDMAPYVCGPKDGPLIYDLFAVTLHNGSLNFGHYTAISTLGDGHWYYFDDANVSELQTSRVVTTSAYMLMYVRRAPGAPPPPILPDPVVMPSPAAPATSETPTTAETPATSATSESETPSVVVSTSAVTEAPAAVKVISALAVTEGAVDGNDESASNAAETVTN